MKKHWKLVVKKKTLKTVKIRTLSCS